MIAGWWALKMTAAWQWIANHAMNRRDVWRARRDALR